MKIPGCLKKVRHIKLTAKDLIIFEEKVKKYYEDAKNIVDKIKLLGFSVIEKNTK